MHLRHVHAADRDAVAASWHDAHAAHLPARLAAMRDLPPFRVAHPKFADPVTVAVEGEALRGIATI